MSSAGQYGSFSIGRVASRTFGVIGRNAVTFFVLAAIAVIPQLVLSGYLGIGDIAKTQPGAAAAANLFANAGSILLVSLVSVVLGAILQVALVHGTIADLNGKKASFGEAIGTGTKYALPVIGLSILLGLGLVLGFILLIVPGVLLGLRWIVALPALVVEQTGVTGAFGRSSQLTEGHRWNILALVVVAYLISIALSLVLIPLQFTFLIAGSSLISKLPYLAAAGVVHIIVATIFTTGIASLYYELRSVKEGIAPEQLAAVFD